jgi:ribosome-binding protein aMBF1 (putative translation factor)
VGDTTKKMFRITKVAAKIKLKTCEMCGDQISIGHKITIGSTIYCDKCVVSGFLKNEERNRGFLSNVWARLTGTKDEIEIHRYIEKRNQRQVFNEQATADSGS